MFQPTGRQGELREYLGGKTKLAIVGFCQTNRDLAPYEDPSFDVWGLNRAYIFMVRSTAYFEMHGPHIVGYEGRRPGKHTDWLKAFAGPIYMHKADPEIPNSVTYPLKEIAQYIGGTLARVDDQGQMQSMAEAPYLSSSIAFEIALGIYEGYEEIHLYGIDLQTDSEYAWQKPGVEHLLGIALGKGIKVVLPDNCPLLMGNLYGRGYLSPEGEKMSLEQLEARKKGLEKEHVNISGQLNGLIGAKREVEWILDQMVPGIDHERLDTRRRDMQAGIAQIQQRLLQIQGGINETAYWIHQTPNGQDPKEAVAQLKNGNGHMDGEGPLTDLQLMQSPLDPVPETLAVGV